MDRKVLMLGWGYPPNIDGGLDVHIANIFEELRNLEVEVDLALPENRAPDKQNIIGIKTGQGGMVEKARSMSSDVVDSAKDYDIIHTHDWFGAEPGFKAKKYSDVKWVSTFHSLSSQRTRNSSYELKKMERAVAENSDSLIAVSNSLSEEISREFGRNPFVIHNGFSTPEKRGKDIKNEMDIKGEMIFYVGRHAEQKGIEHLIYGFKKLLSDINAVLVLGGDGHMRESLEDFVEILGIEEKVKFTGFIDDEYLGDFYSSADVFVSPSINEPFGLTVTEAIESGTPVVATSNGAEEILPKNALVKVEPDSGSIARGIKEALNQEVPEYDSRTWEEVAEETLDVYSRV